MSTDPLSRVFFHPFNLFLTQFQKSYQQNAVLRKIVDRVRNSLELRVVLQTAVDEIAAVMQVDRCSFFWYFHDTHRVQIICESRSPQHDIVANSEIAPAGHSLARLGYYPMETFGGLSSAIASGELIVNHGQPPEPWPVRWCRKWGIQLHQPATSPSPAFLGTRANMMVPLKTQDGSIGFIACLSNQPRHWTATEVELLQSIAQQLEIAIGQAQLYEQTQKQAQRERLVNQITAQTRQSFELEAILKGAITQLLEALQVDRCLVHLVDDINEPNGPLPVSEASETRRSRQSVSREKHLYEACRPPFALSSSEFDVNGPITQWVIENRRRVVISDVTTDERIGPHNPEYQRAEIKSSLVVPVQTKEKLHAILYLNQCSHIRYWSKNDQKLAQAVADQLAISIQQAHLYAQTQQQAAESAAQAQYLADTLHELRLTQAQLIQSEKMSSLGRIVAGIAHEINNPINFIFGNLPYVKTYVHDLIELLEAYQKWCPTPEAELQELADQVELEFILADLPRILHSMQAGAERIREIVLSLRNFARIDEAQYKPVNIHEGIESTLMVLQSYIGEDIEIIRHYTDLPTIECYPRQLNQALLNILLNAVEALKDWPEPKKAIAICTDTVLDNEHTIEKVRIVITDNGPGIPHAIQSKVFDPFFTTKEVGQGAGLGLTVSYQTVVNQHHGQLKLFSEPGLGAEFMIELPVQQSAVAANPVAGST